jgi:hypothetical protein
VKVYGSYTYLGIKLNYDYLFNSLTDDCGREKNDFAVPGLENEIVFPVTGLD